MPKDILEWRDVESEVSMIDTLSLKDVDCSLKNFWASGSIGSKRFDKHVMHLAHGYSHAIMVANLAKKIAEETALASGKDAFTAGLLHDVYRPIETGEGTEKHGEYCAQVSEAILKQAKYKKKIFPVIKNAIELHDLNAKELICESTGKRTLKKLMSQNLNVIVFLADKCHMNMERVMAYAYDCRIYAHDHKTPKDIAKNLDWFKSVGKLGAIDIALSKAGKKFWRDTKIATTIQASLPQFGKYCRWVFDAWENTIDELQSQGRKEQRGEDKSRTLMLYWALKEAISNFRYLSISEKTLYARKGDSLWDFLHNVIGRYQSLFLTELEGEPFVDILNYRRKYGAK